MRHNYVNFFAFGRDFCALACVLVAAMLPRVAAAQQDLLRFRLETTPTIDSNVFRVPDGVSDPQTARGIAGKSDLFNTTTFVLSFNKTYAQQAVLLELGQSAVRYDKFSFLNRNATNYRAAWQWRLTPRVGGTLSADSADSVIGFDDTQSQALIITTTSNRNVSVDGLLFGGWHLLAGAGHSERKTSVVFLAAPSSSQVSGEFGVRYDAAGRGSISLVRRSARGTNTGQEVDLVNFIDSGFRTRETDLRATWVLSGKSTLNGNLGWTERRHENVPQRNFSGTNSGVSVAWTPTGKLSIGASVARAVLPFSTGTSSTYRVDDTLALTPVWRISEKVNLSMRASRRKSDFLGPVVAAAGPDRRDVENSLQFGADWSPSAHVTLRASLQRARRTSTDAALLFDDTIASMSASLTF